MRRPSQRGLCSQLEFTFYVRAAQSSLRDGGRGGGRGARAATSPRGACDARPLCVCPAALALWAFFVRGMRGLNNFLLM